MTRHEAIQCVQSALLQWSTTSYTNVAALYNDAKLTVEALENAGAIFAATTPQAADMTLTMIGPHTPVACYGPHTLGFEFDNGFEVLVTFSTDTTS